MEEEIIKDGKYTFKIKTNIMRYGDRILSHTITIGGDFGNCASVSYTYRDNKPISASLPYLLYEPECTIGADLDRSGGTVKMIKLLLNYAYKKIPDVHIFGFDDMSKIECVEKDLSLKPPRKLREPIDLYYFSIVYHDMTWYELNFNAKMENKDLYLNYRNNLGFLTSKEIKSKLEFIHFLELIKAPLEHIEYLKEKYEKTETFRDFFKSIPKDDRCKYLQHWITPFMENYLKKYFFNKGWEIDVLDMESNKPAKVGGKYTRKRNIKNRIKYRVNNEGKYHAL
jgi:hypothetical protein